MPARSARSANSSSAVGLLTGHAVGEDVPLTPATSLIDDLKVVFATITVEKVWSETVVERLAELRPEALTAALKPYGISTGHQVWGRLEDGTGANRRGLFRAEVLAAVERREIDS